MFSDSEATSGKNGNVRLLLRLCKNLPSVKIWNKIISQSNGKKTHTHTHKKEGKNKIKKRKLYMQRKSGVERERKLELLQRIREIWRENGFEARGGD